MKIIVPLFPLLSIMKYLLRYIQKFPKNKIIDKKGFNLMIKKKLKWLRKTGIQ